MKPIVSIQEVLPICGGCPSDWESRDHLGREIYIRYRWGRLTARVTEENGQQEYILDLRHGDPLDGVMELETMIELTKEAIDWVGHRIHFKT